jgi:hypothetical protein
LHADDTTNKFAIPLSDITHIHVHKE